MKKTLFEKFDDVYERYIVMHNVDGDLIRIINKIVDECGDLPFSTYGLEPITHKNHIVKVQILDKKNGRYKVTFDDEDFIIISYSLLASAYYCREKDNDKH